MYDTQFQTTQNIHSKTLWEWYWDFLKYDSRGETSSLLTPFFNFISRFYCIIYRVNPSVGLVRSRSETHIRVLCQRPTDWGYDASPLQGMEVPRLSKDSSLNMCTVDLVVYGTVSFCAMRPSPLPNPDNEGGLNSL